MASFEAVQGPPRKIPKRELASPPVAATARREIGFLHDSSGETCGGPASISDRVCYAV